MLTSLILVFYFQKSFIFEDAVAVWDDMNIILEETSAYEFVIYSAGICCSF